MDLTLTTTSYGVDDQSWVGSRHGINEARPVTLELSGFTAATHYPDGWLLSGLPLGRVTATGRYVLFDPDYDADPATAGVQTDGREILRGFLLVSVKATGSPVGALLDHGKVVLDRLPVTVTAAQLPASFTAVL